MIVPEAGIGLKKGGLRAGHGTERDVTDPGADHVTGGDMTGPEVCHVTKRGVVGLGAGLKTKGDMAGPGNSHVTEGGGVGLMTDTAGGLGAGLMTEGVLGLRAGPEADHTVGGTGQGQRTGVGSSLEIAKVLAVHMETRPEITSKNSVSLS